MNSAPSDVFTAFDLLFVFFYTIELGMKLVVHRLYFFLGEHWHWNIFDFFLVCTGINDQVTAHTSTSGGGGGVNLIFLRTLRLLKMARILRLFRLMRSLRELRLMLTCLLGSIFSLLWSIVMMLLIFFMFGLVFVQSTSGYFAEMGEDLDPVIKKELSDTFGSVHQAMLGLFMATTGGNDWSIYYEALTHIGPLTPTVYLFYVCFSQIALLNVLTGIFVENAMKLAEPDRQAVYAEGQRQYLAQVKELELIMKELDKNHNGRVDDNDFAEAMTDSKCALRTYFGVNGIHEAEAMRFFHMLQASENNKEVSIASFVRGCLKLSGSAQSLDIQGIACELQLMHRKLPHMFQRLAADLRKDKDKKRYVNVSSAPLVVV
jgi:voltage-gated sodium channel